MSAAFASAAMSLCACSGSLPVPPTGPHTGDEPVIVPYPPPPARAEIIPPRPADAETAVWVDGEWQWTGRRWTWQGGRWEVPYPGAYYAPPTTVSLSDGTIAWFPGTWHLPK